MTYSRLLMLALAISLTTVVADAACGADGSGGFYSNDGTAPVSAISPTAATGLDITLASASYNYTLFRGNPSLWGYLMPGGYVEYTVFAPAAGTYGLQAYYATAAQGAGADLVVNGGQQGALNLASTGSWGTMRMSGRTQITLPSGQSVVRIAAQQAFQPYNLAGLLVTPIATSTVVAPPPAPAVPVTTVNPNGTTSFDITFSAGSNGYSLYLGNPSLWGNLQPGGYVEYSISAAAAGNYALQIYYSTTLSGGAAVLVNGVQQQAATFPSTGSWGNFAMSSPVTVNLPAGPSTLRIAAQNSFEPYNLEGMKLAPVSQAPAATIPLANEKFYVNPYSEAQNNIGQSCSSFYPDSSGLLAKIAAQPQGVWFGDWNQNIQSDAASVLNAASQQSATPIMVVYNIPMRDCSGYSSGGAADAGAYQTWIQGLAAGIGAAKALVILEPDALMQLTQPGCLNSSQQTERVSLLNYAVNTLRQTAPNAAVYIDAGRAGQWEVPPADIAQRLEGAGVANAAGFALNVSNYIATDVTTLYGQQISALTGNKHFVIDTSRNGLGPDGDLNWCNPPNRGLGAPSQAFNSGVVDAYVWAQNPGTSDGSCNGAPPAGQFSVQIACTLAHNATF